MFKYLTILALIFAVAFAQSTETRQLSGDYNDYDDVETICTGTNGESDYHQVEDENVQGDYEDGVANETDEADDSSCEDIEDSSSYTDIAGENDTDYDTPSMNAEEEVATDNAPAYC